MKEKIEQIRQQALAAIEDAAGIDKLNDVKVAFLGKKGQLSSLLKGMKDVAPEDRPKVGQMVNEARAGIEAKMEEKRTAIQKKLREEKMKKEVIDVTLPGKKVAVGHRHPNQIALDDLERVFIYIFMPPRINAATAGVLIITSVAGARPCPLARGIRVCTTTARRVEATCTRICCC